MFDWAKAVLGLIGLLSSVIAFLREKQMLDAGEQKALAEAFRVQADDLEKAQKAAEKALAAARAAPSGSLPDDGFRRD